MYILLFLSFAFIDVIVAGDHEKKETKRQFVEYADLDRCEGKDAHNYTFLGEFIQDHYCHLHSLSLLDGSTLTACLQNQKKSVNELYVLVGQVAPAGAFINGETLCVSKSGNLEGKYIYFKLQLLSTDYMKKCATILGYSYVTTKQFQILIADKLDLNCFISPSGCYDVFKKSATTICNGAMYVF